MADKSFSGFFESIPETDFAAGWLKQIFAPVFDDAGAHTIISEAAGTINAGLLLAASLAVAWYTLAGVVNTAQDGKVLGHKWHQVWAPLRVGLGIAMLAPIKGGFGVAQLLVLHIAMLGVGFADTVWATASQKVANGGQVSVHAVPDSDRLMKDLLRLEVCREAAWQDMPAELQKLLTSPAKLSGTKAAVPKAPVAKQEDVTSGIFTKSIVARRYSWDYGVCGSVSIEVAAEAKTTNSGQTYVGVAEKGQIAAAQVAQVEKAMESLRSVAASFVTASRTGGEFPTTAHIDSAKVAYDKAMQEAAKKASTDGQVKARQRFAEKAKEGGWAAAGTWFVTLSTLSGEYTRAASIVPTVNQPQLGRYQNKMTPWFGTAAKTLADADAWWADRYDHKGVGMPSDVEQGGGESIWNRLDFLSPGKVAAVYEAAELTQNDPLGSMVSLGHTALITAESLTLGGVVLWAAGGSLVGDAVGGGSALTFLLPLAWFVLGGLYAVGIMHAYVLPMLPYVFHTLASFGWLVFVCEAVVAAPLWALMHVRFDGAELVDRAQSPGYLLAFNLFLRPVLITLGMLLALAVFPVTIGFVNATFLPAVRAATSGHYVGVLGMVVLLGILTYLHWQLAIRSFQLITLVPDRVSRWFGAGAESMGESEATDKHVNVVGAAIGKAEGASNRMKSAKDKGGDDEGGNGNNGTGSGPFGNTNPTMTLSTK